jgi:hypothetical protein
VKEIDVEDPNIIHKKMRVNELNNLSDVLKLIKGEVISKNGQPITDFSAKNLQDTIKIGRKR